MMYLWQDISPEFLRLSVNSCAGKEVQKFIDNNMAASNKVSIRRMDYESEGRAFESLRVRQFLRVCEDLKNSFVPLFKSCTSFLEK
jgi:hypothetical protein